MLYLTVAVSLPSSNYFSDSTFNAPSSIIGSNGLLPSNCSWRWIISGCFFIKHWWTRRLIVFILAQLYRWNLHGNTVAFLSLSINSAAGKPLLIANGISRILEVGLIAKRKYGTKKVLGFFDWLSCWKYFSFDIHASLLLTFRWLSVSGFLLLWFELLVGELATGGDGGILGGIDWFALGW